MLPRIVDTDVWYIDGDLPVMSHYCSMVNIQVALTKSGMCSRSFERHIEADPHLHTIRTQSVYPLDLLIAQ